MTKKHNLIQSRIRARKMTLSYFYWRIFVLRASKNEALLGDIIGSSRGLEDVHDKTQDNVPEEQINLSQGLMGSFGESVDSDIEYVADHCFDKRPKDSIDMEYVLMIARGFDEYHSLVKEKVNEHTTTFSFDQMDPMDQAIFILGYMENSLIGTPKNILINEVIELAKRYASDGSAKMIHGIIHKIIIEKKNIH